MADFTENPDGLRETLLDAALMHVPFDGWSEATFRAAAADAGIGLPEARTVCPRGALDLAVAFHKRGDAVMLAQLEGADLDAMKIREKVTFAVRARLEAIEDKEAVRRGSALFALPIHAAEGAHREGHLLAHLHRAQIRALKLRQHHRVAALVKRHRQVQRPARTHRARVLQFDPRVRRRRAKGRLGPAVERHMQQRRVQQCLAQTLWISCEIGHVTLSQSSQVPL